MSENMSCEFSVPAVGAQAAISPNNQFIASVTSGNRVTVRSMHTWEVMHIFQCVDKIDKLEISPDSCYVMCALLSRNVIQVFSLQDKDWKCRINEGVAGMIDAYWTPDSRNVVAESDFGIQLSLWSLTDANSVIVNLPKPPSPLSKTSAFSDCGRFLAVVHRIELQDQIGVYSVDSQTSLGMSEISKFRARSNDVASVYWVPSGTHIITLDSPLTFRFCAYTPMGECLANFEAYQNALGIRCIGLSKSYNNNSALLSTGSTATGDSSKFIALGAFDSKVRLISAYSYQTAFVLPLVHPKEMDAGFNSADVQLTVEVSMVHSGTLMSRLTEQQQQEDEAGAEDASASANTTPLRQKQVPPAQQTVKCKYQRRRHNYSEVENALFDEEAAAQAAGEDADTAVDGAQDQQTAQQDSGPDAYFALRSLKTLPRAQPFVLDTKRAAAGSTVGKASTTTGVGAAGKRTLLGTTGNTVSTTGASSSISHGSSLGAGFPAVGVSWVGWSASGALLAARDEAHPRCMWVWSPLQAKLVALVVTLDAIVCARWRPQLSVHNASDVGAGQSQVQDPHTAPLTTSDLPVPPPAVTAHAAAAPATSEMLAFCTGTEKVYFWTPLTGVTFTDMTHLSSDRHAPQTYGNSGAAFAVMSLRWSKDGRSLILKGKESHCVCQVNV